MWKMHALSFSPADWHSKFFSLSEIYTHFDVFGSNLQGTSVLIWQLNLVAVLALTHFKSCSSKQPSFSRKTQAFLIWEHAARFSFSVGESQFASGLGFQFSHLFSSKLNRQ